MCQERTPMISKTERLIASMDRLAAAVEREQNARVKPDWVTEYEYANRQEYLRTEIRKMQRTLHVPDDGVIGPETLGALRRRGLTWNV